MAINILRENYKNDDDMDAVTLEIANGDLRALKEITNSYGVNDITDIIAFAIGVMKESDGRPVAATRVDGSMRKFVPADSIRKNDRTKEEN